MFVTLVSLIVCSTTIKFSSLNNCPAGRYTHYALLTRALCNDECDSLQNVNKQDLELTLSCKFCKLSFVFDLSINLQPIDAAICNKKCKEKKFSDKNKN